MSRQYEICISSPSLGKDDYDWLVMEFGKLSEPAIDEVMWKLSLKCEHDHYKVNKHLQVISVSARDDSFTHCEVFELIAIARRMSRL